MWKMSRKNNGRVITFPVITMDLQQMFGTLPDEVPILLNFDCKHLETVSARIRKSSNSSVHYNHNLYNRCPLIVNCCSEVAVLFSIVFCFVWVLGGLSSTKDASMSVYLWLSSYIISGSRRCTWRLQGWLYRCTCFYGLITMLWMR